MSDATERAYMSGRRAVLRGLLADAARELGYGRKPDAYRLIVEREQAIAALRTVCEEYGDNDWPDELSLADIITKHLARPMEEDRR